MRIRIIKNVNFKFEITIKNLKVKNLDSRFRGGDREGVISVFPLSFPRKWESILCLEIKQLEIDKN